MLRTTTLLHSRNSDGPSFLNNWTCVAFDWLLDLRTKMSKKGRTLWPLYVLLYNDRTNVLTYLTDFRWKITQSKLSGHDVCLSQIFVGALTCVGIRNRRTHATCVQHPWISKIINFFSRPLHFVLQGKIYIVLGQNWPHSFLPGVGRGGELGVEVVLPPYKTIP